RLAEAVRGDLAPVQAGLEVPQRPLAAQRRVDAAWRAIADGDGVALEVDEERRVARPGHPPLEHDLGASEQVERPRGDAVVAQFIRGHGCPSGSIGLPHHRHAGRPAAMISSAWSQNAAAWLRVTYSRT